MSRWHVRGAAWMSAALLLTFGAGRAHAQAGVRPSAAVGPQAAGWQENHLTLLETDPDPARRRQAAATLGQYGDGQAIRALAKAAAFDPDRAVRVAGGDAIAAIRQRTHDDWIRPTPAPGPEYRERIVRAWYRLYLQREPDAGGLAQWVGELDRGTAPEAVQATLLGSDEYYKLHGGTLPRWLASLYRDLLGRSPSVEEI